MTTNAQATAQPKSLFDKMIEAGMTPADLDRFYDHLAGECDSTCLLCSA